MYNINIFLIGGDNWIWIDGYVVFNKWYCVNFLKNIFIKWGRDIYFNIYIIGYVVFLKCNMNVSFYFYLEK